MMVNLLYVQIYFIYLINIMLFATAWTEGSIEVGAF